MLDIGWSELVVIGVVALVVVGPKELPTLLRTAGQWIGKARRMAGEFQGQINDAIREAELEDVKKSVDDLRSLSPTKLITDHLGSIADDVSSAGAAAKSELAGLEAGIVPPFAGPADAGSSLSAFMEGPAEPTVSAHEAERLIDAAAPQVDDLAHPVFDLTPAPMPTPAVDVAEAAPAEIPAPDADKKATGA